MKDADAEMDVDAIMAVVAEECSEETAAYGSY